MTTQDDERAAREWLETWACRQYGDGATHATTILRLLDRPALPRGEDVPDEVVDEMGRAHRSKYNSYVEYSTRAGIRAAIDVLHAHLSAPPPVKKVEMWSVQWKDGTFSTYQDEELARCWGKDSRAARIVHLVEAADE